MKTAIGIWAGNEISRRWRALVALGVLAGLVGSLALAAVAGARRTSTAYERYREATGRADAIVFATLLGIFGADYSPVRDLPEVEDAGEFTLAPLGLEGLDIGQLAPNDDRLYRTISRPLLTVGRLPDPERDDEILVNRQAAKLLGLGVGDRVKMVSATDFEENGPLGSGPSVEATIVGVGDATMDLIFQGDGPAFVPSGAMLRNHPEIPRAGNLVVRLRPGTDVEEFGRRAAEAMDLPFIPVRDVADDSKRITRGTDLERTALLLFAAAVALAGVVLVGQALARTVFALEQPAGALRALGFTRNALVSGMLIPLAVTAVTALVTALGAAVALSRLFPVGLAGRLESDRGVHADWVVVLPGAVAVAVVVLARAALSAVRATSRTGRRPVTTRFSVVPALRRLGAAPLPAVIGAGLALERGEGDRQLPVRPALVSAVAAVLGVVGAFGLLAGIDDALANPERAGQFWDADILPGEDLSFDQVLTGLAAEERVDGIYVVSLADIDLDGASAPVYALDRRQGSHDFTLLDGRRPEAADEIVIGPATAKALGKGIGDIVHASGTEERDLRVVGTGLLPQTPHFSFDQGGWMTAEGFDVVRPPSDEARETTVLVGFRSGVPVKEGVAALEDRFGPGVEVETSSLPLDVGLLRNVRTLPKALAGFLVLLGLGALGHVLATAVRRRRHDLAVLRALGFRPLQVAGCVTWQSVTVGVVALLLGLPLGTAVGRWSWRWVADSTPLLYVPPVAATVALLAVPAALVLANLMSALPARRAARLRPAEVLRAE